jgi:hypothetical protein
VYQQVRSTGIRKILHLNLHLMISGGFCQKGGGFWEKGGGFWEKGGGL